MPKGKIKSSNWYDNRICQDLWKTYCVNYMGEKHTLTKTKAEFIADYLEKLDLRTKPEGKPDKTPAQVSSLVSSRISYYNSKLKDRLAELTEKDSKYKIANFKGISFKSNEKDSDITWREMNDAIIDKLL